MRAPTASGRVSSGYGVKRADGRMHWGDDMPGRAGEAVYAPEGGIVTAVEYGHGTAIALPHPWNGYGPGVVQILGDTGVWHTLAHVRPGVLAPGVRVEEGAAVGTLPAAVGASGPHVHWEVRTGHPIDDPTTRAANTVDPQEWLATARGVQAAQAARPAWQGGGGAPAADGGWGVLLLVALLLLGGRR